MIETVFQRQPPRLPPLTTVPLVVGIDPGKLGAAAVIDLNGRLQSVACVPLIGSGKQARVSSTEFQEWLRFVVDQRRHHYRCQIGDVVAVVVIEQVSGHAGDSTSAAFEFGRALGTVEAVVDHLGLRRVEVTPQQWQLHMLRGLPRADKKQRKISAHKRAQELWPELTASVRQHADALLIAEYARRLAYDRHWTLGYSSTHLSIPHDSQDHTRSAIDSPH